MAYCILCKEMTDQTYSLTARENGINNGVEGHLCASCYQRMIDSFHNRRSFKLALLKTWSKRKLPAFQR